MIIIACFFLLRNLKFDIFRGTIFQLFSPFIVFVWSQYDGANIEQWTKGYGWRQNQEAKLKNVGGVISWSNQQLLIIPFYSELLTFKKTITCIQ